MLSEKEIEKLALLARISLSEEEKSKFQKEISEILDFFQDLKVLDTEGVEPMSHAVNLENVTRPDDAEKFENSEELIDLAPEREKRFFKVKNVFDV